MKTYLQRLLKVAAYTAAGVVILLAVAVGLFRLFLPRLPEYQDEIKAWASTAIGMQVEFSGMDARWGLRGPELKFYGAELIRPGNDIRVVAAREVGVGVSLLRLFVDRTLVVDTVTVSDTRIEVRRTLDGEWLLQGIPASELLQFPGAGGVPAAPLTLIGQDIVVQLVQPGDERPHDFELSRLLAERDDVRIAIDANVQLPESIGRQLSLSATHIHSVGDAEPWHISVVARNLLLAGIFDLLPEESRRLTAGSGDLDATVAVAGRRIVSASGQIDFQGVTLGNGTQTDITGRIAYNNDQDGWLLAADEFSLRTSAGEWPASSLRLETGTDETGAIVMFDASASYVNLSDAVLALPWLNETYASSLAEWRPEGAVENLQATFSELDTAAPHYSLSADLLRIGASPGDKRPGFRGFSGVLRAGHDGGLVEIDSTAAALELPAWFSRPIEIDSANGTVVWRRGDSRTTVLSDSITLRNAFFDSQSNVEITFDGEGPPDIDLVSTWSIADIVAAKDFLPESLMKPRLFLWLHDALVAGRIPAGETRLRGPLDKFPFDGGEGRLYVRSSMRDLVLRYARQFPLVNVGEMEVVLENTRLFTEQNRSTTLGNATVDAKVEIADLRKPVLSIDAYSTGSLETLRNFAANSPIGRVFGGQLDRVTVAGDASLSLDLTVPLTDLQAYAFTARIASDSGSLAVAGLKPPITALSGSVTIEREQIGGESLVGQFLGAPVSIELWNAGPELPGFRVVSSVTGTATAAALLQAFDLPLEDRFDGAIAYRADVLFPRAGLDAPSPLTIEINTDLAGLAVDLPPPFRKAADASRPLNAQIAFLPGGEYIRTRGQSGEEFAWQLTFAKTQDGWDFDRGVLALGDTPMTQPEVRGLHIRGRTPEFRLDEWLALSRGEADQRNPADRIRSIDLRVTDLYLLGQHLTEHEVRVDRSARDWLVQMDGDLVSGSVFVPYDFSANRALVLDMERLMLPGDDEVPRADREKPPLDPRRLPPISLKAKQFALGERSLGAVEAEFVKTPDGLASDAFVARDETFEIVGNGSWLADANDPQGSRSYLSATLTSTDVAATMARLDYQPGIVSDEMNLTMDMSWSGGPSWDFLSSLDGDVQVRLGSGQLDEVEPGAGRMFGLMSVVALPRRLSLDFRDVFQKGFGFDNIQGSFRLDNGVAYTCNLSLEGPAADIGIIGQADLVNRDYAQAAVVSGKVGDTLPIVGALAAGPQAAAALFLLSRIFREPLQDIGQIYYSVSGSWDEPVIDSADAKVFAAIGDRAGCLDDSE